MTETHNKTHSPFASVVAHPWLGMVRAEHRLMDYEHRAVTALDDAIAGAIVRTLCAVPCHPAGGPPSPMIRLAKAAHVPDVAREVGAFVGGAQKTAGCAFGAVTGTLIGQATDNPLQLAAELGALALAEVVVHAMPHHPHDPRPGS